MLWEMYLSLMFLMVVVWVYVYFYNSIYMSMDYCTVNLVYSWCW